MKKVVKLYDKLEKNLLCLCLAANTLLVFVQVIFRYVFNNSLSWSEEIARYLYIWMLWLATSVTLRENRQINLDMLYNKLKGKAQIALGLVADLLQLAFCLFLTKYGFDLVVSIFTRGNLSVGAHIPMWIVYLALPFSQLIVSLRLIGRIVTKLRSLIGRQPLREEEQV